jgi:hypothetical protein
LTPLATLAEDLQVSILVVAHLNKDSKKEAIDRIGGSVGIANTARSVLFVGPDPDDPEGIIKMLAHAKCNVGPQQPTLKYRTETVLLSDSIDPIETTRIVWEGEAPGVTADDLVVKQDTLTREDRTQAIAWLERALPIGIRRKQHDLETEAQDAGLPWWSIRKAKVVLGVQSQKRGFKDGWVWWRSEAANHTPHLSPSEKTPSKSLKNAKGSEGESPRIFDASSAHEAERKSASLPFDASSNISTTYTTLTPEGESQGSYIEEEVDLRVD